MMGSLGSTQGHPGGARCHLFPASPRLRKLPYFPLSLAWDPPGLTEAVAFSRDLISASPWQGHNSLEVTEEGDSSQEISRGEEGFQEESSRSMGGKQAVSRGGHRRCNESICVLSSAESPQFMRL
jgi:hypothetical protein